MAALWRLDAHALAQGYRSGTCTPVDALQDCLAQAAAWQPHTNAFVLVDAEGAMRAAQASRDRWARGAPLGALDGVPVSVKDNMHVAGLPTTWGSRALRDCTPADDEACVARLRAAGAILFGKTNLPEFAMQGYTANAVAGITRNPWDTACTPGGSSGGAAAAVAAGCGPLALATDGGGSIRRPAALCGIVGFKPSAALVPRGGGLPDIFLHHESAGPMARTVRDAIAMTQVLSGSDLAPPAPTTSLRILHVPRLASHPVDAGIAQRVREAAVRLQALGHAVDEAPALDFAEEVHALWPRLSQAGLAWMVEHAPARWPEFAGGLDIGAFSDAARAQLDAGRALGAHAVFELLAAMRKLEHALAVLFARYDILLMPATAAMSWPADATHPDHIAGTPVGARGHAVYTAFANAAGLPAITLPCDGVDGMPTGFQLVARAGTDARLLALALQYETTHPRTPTWPTLPP